MLQRKLKLFNHTEFGSLLIPGMRCIFTGSWFCSSGISLERVSAQAQIINVQGSQLWLFSSLWIPVTVCGKENLFLKKSVSWICSVLSFLPRFALRFIRPDPRSRVTDPVGDIISFIHMFEEKYGRIHPVFYQGTYSQVSVTCWCLDPGDWGFCHTVSGPTWQNCFYLQAQHLSPNSLNRVMES